MTVAGVPDGHLRTKATPTMLSTRATFTEEERRKELKESFGDSSAVPRGRDFSILSQILAAGGGTAATTVPDGEVWHIYAIHLQTINTTANQSVHIVRVVRGGVTIFELNYGLGSSRAEDLVNYYIPIVPELVLNEGDSVRIVVDADGSSDIRWNFWVE